MPKDELVRLITEAIQKAQQQGALPAFPLPAVEVEHPREAARGDYATSVAMKLAREAKAAPLKIAQAISAQLPANDLIGAVEIAPPGFINVRLSDAYLARQVDEILKAGQTFGNVDIGRGQRAQVEFVSANPTGPLHIGSARNAAIGDVLASVLSAANYRVEREYYVNDSGSQVRKFGESVYARYQQLLGHAVTFPADGYQGQYIADIAQEIIAAEGERFLSMPAADAMRALGKIGLDWMVADARKTLEAMGVRFDVWFSERSLYESGLFDRILQRLGEMGLLVEKDGAVWFAAQELGEDKDAVIIRSPQVIPEPSERPTYFASDIAYLWNKYKERGFDRVVYVWGSDHHGDVARVKAAARVLDIDLNKLDIIIYQLVNILRSGEQVRMSKRRGDFVMLADGLREVGKDAVRFMLLTRTADNVIEFDLTLAVEQSDQNPVYYVQYAHARIASILRLAAERGQLAEGGEVSRLTHPAEQALIRKMLELPEQIELAARQLMPHVLTHYSLELAAAFHSFYKQCRVLPGESVDVETSRARMQLVRATKQVLARTLNLMGIAAPEQM
ncbi:MAG: arginine--tRNA ligase [Chloroflexi bacterium]|nr:arginine--tRNA ligase [Chloroflexota bacterium]